MSTLKNLPTVNEMVDNIIKAYDTARTDMDPATFEAAAVWYRTANVFVSKTAETFGQPFSLVLWLTAYLSQNAKWSVNVSSVLTVLGRNATGQAVTSAGYYASNRMKSHIAAVVASGLDPGQDTLTVEGSRAQKLPSFYANIGRPSDPHAVTIDRHACRIATGNDSDSVPSGGAYDRVADAYRVAAARLGILPNVLQAITWTHRVGDLP